MSNALQIGLVLATCSSWLPQTGEVESRRSPRPIQGAHSSPPRDPAGAEAFDDPVAAHGDARTGDAGNERRVFVYTAGAFIRKRGGKWVEHRFEGPPSHFVETCRTPEFVELYDRDRDLLVRLRDGHGEWLVRESDTWAPWPGSEGRWT